MTEVTDAVTLGGAYKESDSHVPDPTDQFGTLDTSGTAGTAHGQVDAVTPIFEVAKVQDRLAAARALDPNDDSVSPSLVVLPQGMVVSESGEQAARDRVAEAAKNVEPVEVGGPNAYQKAAAESGEAKGEKADNTLSGGGLDGGNGGTEVKSGHKAAPVKSAGGSAG